MPEETLTQVGVGGIIVILVLREVFGFMKNRNGSTPITKTEFEKHKDSVQYKDNCTEVVKRMDMRFDNIDERLGEVKQLIKNR